MLRRVFVVMPIGVKESIDFKAVYRDLVMPVLKNIAPRETRVDEECEVFLAGEELAAGNFHTDIFPKLLLADLVVADLSFDSPNLEYQLAIRHALRAPGGILIQCQQDGRPADGYADHRLRYHLKDGAPDPAFLSEDRKKLAAMVRDTTARLCSRWQPRQVFLFSGHMIDAPSRPTPRFPAAQEAIAAQAIRDTLDTLNAGSDDLALCSAACGGDILFAEACLQRGLRLEVRLPFAIPTFLEKSVTFAGEEWNTRFHTIKDNPRTTLFVMPDELGPTPVDANPYTRTNLWLLYSALAWGEDKVHFICLWNRLGGDGPGGTKHMHDEVNKRTGQVRVLDTNKLFIQGPP